jgi:hypothetical protein
MHLSDVVSKRRSVYQMLPALNLSLRPAINNDISNPWRQSAYEMALKENRKLADIARKENEKLAENIDTLKQQLANNTLELQRLQMQIENVMGEERAAEKKELEREIAELKKTIDEPNNVDDLRRTLDTLNQELTTQVAELNKLREAAIVNPIVTEPSAVVTIQEEMKELIKTVNALRTHCQKRLDSELRKDSPPPTEQPSPIPEGGTTTTKNGSALDRAKMANQSPLKPRPTSATPATPATPAEPPGETEANQTPTSETPAELPGETDRLRPSAGEKARTSRNRGGGFNRRAKTQPGKP